MANQPQEAAGVGGGSLPTGLVDSFGRVVNYLRVSLTPVCNLRCLYCRPLGRESRQTTRDILSDDEVVRAVEAAASLGVTVVRFTGGEPLLRQCLPQLIRRVSSIPGLADIAMTTNGVLLAERVHELAEAGLRRVNISLDSLDPGEYGRITGCDTVSRVLRSIDAALAGGLHPVKVNVVIGLSRHWIEDALRLAEMAVKRPLHVRFIEYMPTKGGQPESVATAEMLLDTMAKRWNLVPAVLSLGNGPARYFQLNAGAGAIGVVTPMSAPFCATCNRLRLTSQGCLRPCLFSDRVVDLRPALRSSGSESAAQLRRGFELAVLAKPRTHHRRGQAKLLTMADVGG